jgi:hypothetical protein
MNCPKCQGPVKLFTRIRRVARGGRTLDAPSNAWECASGCKSYRDENAALRFQTGEQIAENDAVVASAWRETFGSPMPPSTWKPPEERWTEALLRGRHDTDDR